MLCYLAVAHGRRSGGYMLCYLAVAHGRRSGGETKVVSNHNSKGEVNR